MKNGLVEIADEKIVNEKWLEKYGELNFHVDKWLIKNEP